MKNNPLGFAVVKYLVDIIALALMLFLTAGTLNYVSGWVLVIFLMIAGIVYGAYMFVFHPELMSKRMGDREKSITQLMITGAGLMVFSATIILSGLTFRFGWYSFPEWRYFISIILLVGGCCLLVKVIKINSFLSTTIKVENEQKVIQTGPYGVVRHPMYSAITMLILAVIISLGSCVALLTSVLLVPILVLRITDEEKVLSENLGGYKEYMEKTRYRVIPFIW